MNSPSPFSFNSQLSNLKNTLVLWEDVVAKTMKLSSSLRSVIQCIAGFLEAFQRVADSAYGSNCGLRELGSAITRFCLRERGLESRLRTFNSQLVDCLASPLADRLEEWRRTVTQLDRENSKEWRRARSELQRVSCEVDKLNRRFRRKVSSSVGPDEVPNGSDPSLQTGGNVQLNFMQHDLDVKQRTLAELERSNLRRAVVEERRRFAELITCLRPVLESQLTLLSDVKCIEECTSAIAKHSIDPNELPSDTEQAVAEAAEHVSARAQFRPAQRKLTDMRLSAIRLAKSTLSAHGSQASLRSSALSANRMSSTALSNGNDRPLSPTYDVPCHLSEDHPRQQPQQQPMSGLGAMDGPQLSVQPPTSGSGGDSLSLFEANGETHSTAGDTHRFRDSAAVKNAPLYALPNFGSTVVDADSAPTERNGHDNAMQANESIGLDDDDAAVDVTGGGTTEDTEDGETEDEEHLLGPDPFAPDQPKSVLYPNQAIPAPIYTNLNELKKAAAKKFPAPDSSAGQAAQDAHSTDESARRSVASADQPHSNDFAAHTLPSADPSYPDETTSSHGPPPFDPDHIGHVGPMDGYISTCINSGTSTFRRKQSAGAALEHYGPNGQDAMPVYAPLTPGLLRRGSKLFFESNERENERSRERPVNPPRRSSSVSRDLHRIPHQSGLDPYAPLPLRNMDRIDPGIQRVSSSAFIHTDPNDPLLYPSNRYAFKDPSQYASVAISRFQNNGACRAGDRMATMPRLTPPPLAAVRGPSTLYRPNPQPTFGVKVLPSQTMAQPAAEAPGSRSNARSFVRQSSCDASSQMRPMRTSGAMQQRYVGHGQAEIVRDDAITSFID